MMSRDMFSQYGDLIKERDEISERIEKIETEMLCSSDSKDALIKRVLLSQHKTILETLEFEIIFMLNRLEESLSEIEDSYIRRIVQFRVIDRLSWADVATKMGSGYTVDSIKKAFYRYFK